MFLARHVELIFAYEREIFYSHGVIYCLFSKVKIMKLIIV